MEDKQIDQEKEKGCKEDVLSVVKQFISYFEEIDRSREDDNRIKRSSSI